MRTEEEYKNIAEELELSNECLDLANDNYAKLNARLAKVEAERDSLHGIVCDCLKSLGNGSGATKECSIEFLSGAPEEIRLVVSELRADSDALAARVQEMREALGKVSMEANFFDVLVIARTANEALATPDTSAQILARRDAAIWMEAAEICKAISAEETRPAGKGAATDCEDALRAKADELLKGLEKEHG